MESECISSSTDSVANKPVNNSPEPVIDTLCAGIQMDTSTLNKDTSQTPSEATDSTPAELEVVKSNNQLKQSGRDSVTQIPSTTSVHEDKTSQPQQVTKSLIADRIAFEVPIVTDSDNYVTNPKSIFTEVTGPSFYTVKCNLATPPIITKNLPEQFATLPVFGAPKGKEDLQQFHNNKIREFIGDDLTDEEFEKLAVYCSPDHLKTGAEICMPVKAPTHGLLPNDSEEKLMLEKSNMFVNNTNLCIQKKYQLRVDKDLGNHYCKKLKYRGIRLIPLASEDSKTASAETDTPDLVPGKDMLYRVRIYRPYDYNIKYFKGRSRHAVFSCDIVLTGQQKLSVLRDRIVCANDVGMRVDVSSKPDELPPSSAKDVFPSGFLFINNVFYVDTRAGCADLAAGLRAWARRRALGDFAARDLGQVALRDLVLRLGYPEVYVHQGNCEHLFTFSEVRLVGPADPLRLSQYPGHTAASSHQSVYCTTCAEFCAKWIVVGCARVPFDPAFFCDTCFKLYLYRDGKKVGDFKAYCYRGNELNMLKPQG